MVRCLTFIAVGMLTFQVGCQADLSRVSELSLHDLDAYVETQQAAEKNSAETHPSETQNAPLRGQGPGPNLSNAAPTTPLSLRDALLLAFQHSEVVRTVEGGSSLSRIAATQYDPMIFEERLRGEQARFDPSINTGYVGSRIEEPPDSFFGPGLPINTRRDEGHFYASISKPWVTGATTTFGYLPPLAYLFFPNGGSGFNPQYSSAFVLEARQPLLKGAGPSVNLAPIRIAQLTQNQSVLEIKQATLAQVRSIEEAYWDLQGSLAIVQAIDSVLPLLEEAVRIEQLRFESELVTKAELARALLQKSQFQQQRVQAKTDVANKQFRLGNLLGLSRHDSMNFVPVDPPRQTPPQIDAEGAVQVALSERPDLIRQQMAIQVSDLKMMVAGNQARPQLDLQALYRTSGLADQLDDSLNEAGSFQYPDVTVGATFSVPLGLRAARAARRASELEYARNMAILRQSTENVSFQLAEIVREIERAWSEYSIASQRVQYSLEWLRVSSIRFASPPPGGAGPDWLIIQLNDHQQAVRAHVDAVADASQTLARYNGLLARFEEAQGTLLDKRQVVLSGMPSVPAPIPGALPGSRPAPMNNPPAGSIMAPGGDMFHSYRTMTPQRGGFGLPPAGNAGTASPLVPPAGSVPSARQFSLPPTPDPQASPALSPGGVLNPGRAGPGSPATTRTPYAGISAPD